MSKWWDSQKSVDRSEHAKKVFDSLQGTGKAIRMALPTLVYILNLHEKLRPEDTQQERVNVWSELPMRAVQTYAMQLEEMYKQNYTQKIPLGKGKGSVSPSAGSIIRILELHENERGALVQTPDTLSLSVFKSALDQALQGMPIVHAAGRRATDYIATIKALIDELCKLRSLRLQLCAITDEDCETDEEIIAYLREQEMQARRAEDISELHDTYKRQLGVALGFRSTTVIDSTDLIECARSMYALQSSREQVQAQEEMEKKEDSVEREPTQAEKLLEMMNGILKQQQQIAGRLNVVEEEVRILQSDTAAKPKTPAHLLKYSKFEIDAGITMFDQWRKLMQEKSGPGSIIAPWSGWASEHQTVWIELAMKG